MADSVLNDYYSQRAVTAADSARVPSGIQQLVSDVVAKKLNKPTDMSTIRSAGNSDPRNMLLSSIQSNGDNLIKVKGYTGIGDFTVDQVQQSTMQSSVKYHTTITYKNYAAACAKFGNYGLWDFSYGLPYPYKSNTQEEQAIKKFVVSLGLGKGAGRVLTAYGANKGAQELTELMKGNDASLGNPQYAAKQLNTLLMWQSRNQDPKLDQEVEQVINTIVMYMNSYKSGSEKDKDAYRSDFADRVVDESDYLYYVAKWMENSKSGKAYLEAAIKHRPAKQKEILDEQQQKSEAWASLQPKEELKNRNKEAKEKVKE